MRPTGHPWFKPVRFHSSYRPGHDAWDRKPDEAPIIGVTAQGRPVAAPSSGVFAKAMLGAGAGLLFGPGGAVLGFAAGLAAGLITKPKGSV